MEYRSKWQKNWEEVKFCSQRCKQNKIPTQYVEAIMVKLNTTDKSICPSDVLSTEKKKDKVEMEKVRSAARLLSIANKIEITQKNKVVSPQQFKGPIRLRKKK